VNYWVHAVTLSANVSWIAVTLSANVSIIAVTLSANVSVIAVTLSANVSVIAVNLLENLFNSIYVYLYIIVWIMFLKRFHSVVMLSGIVYQLYVKK